MASGGDRLVHLAALMARRGMASRREAVALITAGRVTLDGAPFAPEGVSWRVRADAALDVTAHPSDSLAPISIALHKPVSFHSSLGHRHPGAQRLAKDLLVPGNRSPAFPPPARALPALPRLRKLAVAGRLDADSSGLLIFSQLGTLCRAIVHPSSACEKEYIVHLSREVGEWSEARRRAAMDALARDGARLEGDERPLRRPADVRWSEDCPDGTSLRIVLTQGRHRQVRRMCAQLLPALGRAQPVQVVALRRVRVGRLTLDGLRTGQWRTFEPAELLGDDGSGDEACGPE